MHLFDIPNLISSIGLIGVTGIVFAESGLFFGFFLPGDSLLFTAGLLASQGLINIIALLVLTFIAAVLGDNVGYATGKKIGDSLADKEDSWLFKKSYLEKTEAFYKKYGKKAIIFARFMPIVRTFAPILAGAGNMEYKTFFKYNLIGGFLWTWSILLLGYFLGSAFPNIEEYLTPIIIGIIVLSVLPSAIEIIKSRKAKAV